MFEIATLFENDGAASRRDVLRVAGLGLVAVAGAGLFAAPAAATPDEAKAAIAKFTGNAPLKDGRVKLEMPQVADNGATVPFLVKVDSPMTAQDHVTAIYVVAENNPAPEVAAFRLTPACGEAEVSGRMRLARTQNVFAIARMSDGTCYMAKTEVKVTVGGCST